MRLYDNIFIILFNTILTCIQSVEREVRNTVLLEVASNLASKPLDTNILVSSIMENARKLVNADRYYFILLIFFYEKAIC